MFSFETENRRGYSIKFSPVYSNYLLVSTSQIDGDGGTLYFVRAETDGIIEFKRYEWSDGLFDVGWSKENNNFAMTASGDGTMQLWDLLSCKPHHIYRGHTKQIYSLDWGSILNCNNILTSSWDNTIKIWDSQTAHVLTTYSGENSTLFYSAKHSSYIPHLISSVSTNGKLSLWNSLDFLQKPIISIRAHIKEALTCDWSPFNQWKLVTGGADGMILLWDIRNMAKPTHLIFDKNNFCASPVRRIQFSPFSENVLASTSFDGSIKIWNLNSPQGPLESIQAHDDVCYGFDWNQKNHNQIAVCGWDSKINIFTPQSVEEAIYLLNI